MRRRYCFALSTIALLVCASVTTDSFAQEKTLKEQLIGTWMLMLTSTRLQDGNDVWGRNPIGLLILTNNDYFSSQIMRSDPPEICLE